MVVQAEEGRLIAAVGRRVLVATAVPVERDAVAPAFAGPGHEVRLPGASVLRVSAGALTVDLLAAGVGPALAAASTAGALTAAALDGAPYDLVVSTGIAGGFTASAGAPTGQDESGAPVGSLVVADEITAADLGAETADGFLPVTDLGFGAVTHRPPADLVRQVSAVTGARTGTVLTVSTVTGTAARAAALRARHPRALAEAMEGFGVAEAAAAHGTPVLEIRAVSNPVGPRDRAAWRIGDALNALTTAFGKLTPVLESWEPHDHDR